jgi:hypothetical protein
VTTDAQEPPAIASGSTLSFGSPLSEERAARITAELAARKPATVLDLGCGWGGLLLRILAATPGAHGTGIDKDIAGLIDLAIEAGFRPLRIESVTRGEWEDFESGIAADRGQWLLDHPADPRADEVCAQLDKVRAIWLRGHRDIFGFAYLTLGVPAAG